MVALELDVCPWGSLSTPLGGRSLRLNGTCGSMIATEKKGKDKQMAHAQEATADGAPKENLS